MRFDNLNDIASFYLDGKFLKQVSRLNSEDKVVKLSCENRCKLDIIMETFGHKNGAIYMEDDKKGIFGGV